MANRTIPRLLQTPAVLLLLVWMLVPLGMTLFYSFIRYVLNSTVRPEWTTPSWSNWRGFGNYQFVLNSKDFIFAIKNSLFIVGSILTLTSSARPSGDRYWWPQQHGRRLARSTSRWMVL